MMFRSHRIASLLASSILFVAGLGVVRAYGQVGMTCMQPVVCATTFPCYNVPNGLCDNKVFRWARVTGCNVNSCGGTGFLCNNDTEFPCSLTEKSLPGVTGNCDTMVCYSVTTFIGCKP